MFLNFWLKYTQDKLISIFHKLSNKVMCIESYRLFVGYQEYIFLNTCQVDLVYMMYRCTRTQFSWLSNVGCLTAIRENPIFS